MVKIAHYEKVHTFLHCVYSKVPTIRTNPILQHTIVTFFEILKKNVGGIVLFIKGQLISKCPFGAIVSTKKSTKFF